MRKDKGKFIAVRAEAASKRANMGGAGRGREAGVQGNVPQRKTTIMNELKIENQ
jgi:hypothetical protein